MSLLIWVEIQQNQWECAPEPGSRQAQTNPNRYRLVRDFWPSTHNVVYSNAYVRPGTRADIDVRDIFYPDFFVTVLFNPI